MVRDIARDKSAGSDLRIVEIVNRFKGSLKHLMPDSTVLLTAQWRDKADIACPLLTAKEVAAILGVRVERVYELSVRTPIR